MGKTVALTEGIVVCMDKARTVLSPGHVVFTDDRIVSITDDREELKKYEPFEEMNVKGKIVLPGLVNTHMHMRPARGLGDGLTTPVWHTQYVDKISALMNPDDAYYGALLAMAELIKSGTTTVLGMTIHGKPEFEATATIGIRARLVPHAEDYTALKRHMDVVCSQPGGEEALVGYWLGMEVTSLFTTDQLREVRGCANATGCRIHTHFSEWESEPMSPLIESGFLGNDVILAHCVHVNEEEIRILGEYGVSVAHNPKSNMRLGSGIAPIIKMQSKQVNISLGTDGPLSTYKLDMWEEIRAAALLQRVHNAKALGAWEVLEMATINGAKAMGMESLIGSLEQGKKADIVVVDAEQLHLTPLITDGPHSNLAPLLVFSASASDVNSVIIDGKFVLKERQFVHLDVSELVQKVNRIGKRILSNL